MTAPDTPPTPPAPRTGRPTLLTPDLAESIVQVVSAGNYLKTAAQFAGVGQSTLMSWLARGRAASAAVDAHADGHRVCPSCGTDREADAAAVDAANAEADAAPPQIDGASRAYAVLDRCPVCRTMDQPEVWTLPETELPFLDFLERVTVAETRAEVAAVTHWRRAFPDDWRAARDYLARKRPDQWAAKTTVAISSDEAERRIEAATMAALTAIGVDTDGLDFGDLDGLDGVSDGDTHGEDDGEPVEP